MVWDSMMRYGIHIANSENNVMDMIIALNNDPQVNATTTIQQLIRLPSWSGSGSSASDGVQSELNLLFRARSLYTAYAMELDLDIWSTFEARLQSAAQQNLQLVVNQLNLAIPNAVTALNTQTSSITSSLTSQLNAYLTTYEAQYMNLYTRLQAWAKFSPATLTPPARKLTST